MKIIAFGASYSKDSINKKLAAFAASYFPNEKTEIIDLNNYPLPLFTVDAEKEIGQPQAAKDFLNKISTAGILIISVAEHNGSYTTAFKNLFDWASRINLKMFEGKKLLLLATAPGPRGGISALEAAVARFPIHGAEIIGSFSLPKFAENFSEKKGIINEGLKASFDELMNKVLLLQTPINA
ncbi:NAD(P)H-dependent oxidoreductase [Ferruginibacter lapsinanis]|uniref:NADPH-dependent FMN reductase n=1 Tax=Ferruginibacter lapsinanis TaxID=563172 RepID=UPI001E470928|nr:NAD(P)H-dependent oxidoreductase [Ferruginibacter lapsinanis]UEG50341.1 NAD(P)H-dependent oxidoreductase [Ferruginibacter lapsinanis]